MDANEINGIAQMVQLPGLEPGTFGSTIRRSNQLSYSCTGPKTERKLVRSLGDFKP